MKKKIFSIFGVALTLVLLVSLFGFAVPASAQLPPKDLEWSRVSTPSAMTKQLAAGTDAAFLTLAPDGTTVFAVDTTAATDLVYKSTTSGRTWAASTTNPWGATAITALAVSPAFATDKTVIVGAKDAVTNRSQVYISIDGGTTFAALGGNISATTTEVITSLAISPTYAGGLGEIMLGTVDTATPGMGNVYIWGRLGVLNWVTTGGGLNEDITTVAFSLNYPIDATILAIGTNVAGIGTRLHTQVGAAAWNATIGIPAAGVTTIDSTTTEVGAARGVSDIISSAIAMGSDFNGSVITTHRVYVALVSDGVDDVYQVYMLGPGATVSAMGAGAGDNEYTSLAYSGDFAAGNLLAGNDAYTAGVGTTATVVRCANPTLTMAWLWIGATTPPTGTAAVESADTFTIIDATGVSDIGNITVAVGSVVATPTGTATVLGGSVPVTITPASGAVPWTVTAATDTIIVQAATPYTTGAWMRGAAATASITNDVRWYPASVAALAGAFSLPDSTGPLTYVVMAPDFATSNKVFAGTMGTESALSVSDDGGVNFYQAGLIDTAITNIQDFQPSPDYANDNTMFLVAANTAGPESVWRTTDGSAWYRVLTLATANGTAIVRLSPEFATDQTLYFAETGALTTAIRMSSNAGATWSPRIASVAIADMVVEDANTIYVGGATSGVVAKSITGGWTWIVPATTISYAGMAMPAVNCMARDAATGWIAAGTPMGIVWLSMDKGVTFIPAGSISGYPNISVVAFDGNFATSKMLYCASDTAGTVGIYRIQFMAATSFKRIDTGSGVGTGDIVGMACAADGTLYAADKRGAALTPAGGVLRSITPTAPLTPFDLVSGSFEAVSEADGLTNGYILDSVVVAEGSNKVFAILHYASTMPPFAMVYAVYMYIDTLTTVSPEMVSPADGAISATPTTAILSWGAVTGATGYDYQVSTRSDFAECGIAATNAVPIAAPVTMATATASGAAGATTAIAEGVTYYWRVRAATPVMGPWSSGWSFSSQLATAVNAPTPMSPAPETYTHVNVALAPVFNWSSLKWATGYELQLAKDAAFKSLIVNLTGAKALGNVTSYQLTEDLDYSTTCYWRVRGISATGSSDWSAGVGFTTMAKPVEALPPVVVEEYQPPDIIVEIPPAEAPVSPSWIWAIVIIGAVLVIAVIVLIVRTRRPV